MRSKFNKEQWVEILAKADKVGVSKAAEEYGLTAKSIYNKRRSAEGAKRGAEKRKYTRWANTESPQVQTIIASPRSSKAMVVVCEVSDLSRILAELHNG